MAHGNKLKIHQFHSGSAVADAVTNSMFFVQSLLQDMGFESDIFVQHVDAALSGRIRPLEDITTSANDLLLIHHSMGHDVLSRLADLRCRKFLVYHNITPPQFFSKSDPSHAYALKGYGQLSLLRDIVESAIAVSEFNAQQLRQRDFDNVTVIPLLKDFTEIRYAPHSRTPYHDQSAVVRLLFVGRIVRHKCQHELIDFVDKVRSVGRVPLELALIGHFDNRDDYKSELDELVRTLALEKNVNFIGRVTDAELFGWYRAASAYVSLSEHEGFGVPLVESMAFDLPVIAYPSSAVPDTLGQAGITIPDKDPRSILEPLLRLHEDRAFRGEIIRSQRRRLLRFSRKYVESELRRWLLDVGASDGGNEALGLDTPIEHDWRPLQRTHYVIEGPFETSYSLAIVNRNLALALNDRDACAAHIEPAEGTKSYPVDPIAARRLPFKIQNLVQPAPVDAERIVTIRNTYPPRPNGMLGDLRLVHLAWEESSIPDALTGLINLYLDGVLTPSEYSKQAIRNSGVRVPIAVIGHGIDHSGLAPRVIDDRKRRGPVTPSLPFTFLHISSGLARKGIEELITTYCSAFSSYDPVLLVIKTFDNDTNTIDAWVERLTGASKYSPAIQIISAELDQREVDFLYHIADALVLPTRGEGFNLPAAEAMARGVPVIVTRHSGHLDFCNDQNSFLIDCTYEMSSSHLKIPGSFWGRASVEQLLQAMKTLYRAGREPDTVTACHASQGQRDALQLRWADVAERVDSFIEFLAKRPIMRRKLRLGWISTYNARCGIATHSHHLLEFFDNEAFEITIIADDQEAVGPDPDNLMRLWRKGGGHNAIIDYLITNKFDATFLQYNVGFFEPGDFADMLTALAEENINTFVMLHRTSGLENHRLISYFKLTEALQNCTRIFVHSLEDVNRLRQSGVTGNVVLLPHGVIDRPALNAEAVRGLLGLSGFNPVIGTFGFLLPGKGLPELIHSFALLLRASPGAYLLMVNANYPVPESEAERERCLAVIRQLELEGQTRLINDFLDLEETLFLLSACDIIVFPYQRSEESASGAVRLGLAVGRPVLTTPLAVFSDLSEIVHQLPGTNARDIAEGIGSFLGDEQRKVEIVQRQRDWIRQNSWAAQAERIANIIQGCFEETHGHALSVPRRPANGEVHHQQNATPGSSVEELPAMLNLFERRIGTLRGRAVANRSAAETVNPPSSLTPPAGNGPELLSRSPGFLSRLGLTPMRANRDDTAEHLLSRADRARDSRDWLAAAKYYRKALDHNPERPAIWVQYGHALKESGNLFQAENAYRKSLDLDPDNADTHLQLGHALKLQGKKIEASAAYCQALVLDPALDHAAIELKGLGWTKGRIQLALRRERSGG
jgi:glycosyltransferase involved in cell wall biosynthesis